MLSSFYVCYVRWTCFSTDSRYTQPVLLFCRLGPLFVRGRLYTEVSQEERKEASLFGDFVDRIYPIEFEIKDTTDTARPASYFDLHLKIDSDGRLRK